MKFNESVKATGKLHIQLFDENGLLKDEREIDNLVVTAGLGHIAARLTGVPTAMSHMAAGSGSTAAALGNTTLGTELGRVALSSATTVGAVSTFSATFPAGTATGAITEAGIFNAASNGTMLSRSVFSVINKGALDTMQINWTVTQS